MHRFSKGRRLQVLAQLAGAVIVALVTFYALASLGVPDVVLALVFAAVVLITLTWMYVRLRRQKDEYLRYHTLYDSLTDLPCRALFADRVNRVLDRDDGGSTAVMLIDLDDFKEINHSLGYEAGDILLTCGAERLEESLRPGDTIARLGGDEFTVLLENVADKGSVIAVADRGSARVSLQA